jgi:hypothetical protein
LVKIIALFLMFLIGGCAAGQKPQPQKSGTSGGPKFWIVGGK